MFTETKISVVFAVVVVAAADIVVGVVLRRYRSFAVYSPTLSRFDCDIVLVRLLSVVQKRHVHHLLIAVGQVLCV